MGPVRTIDECAALPGYMTDFSEELPRAFENIEALCEMLRRHPPRASYIRSLRLWTGQPEVSELYDGTGNWHVSWERTQARWKRLFEWFPQLPACTSLDLHASVDYVLYFWLPKLPNVTTLSYSDENHAQIPEMILRPIASSFPSHLQKLELTVYADHHCDMLDGFLSASAWSLRHLKLDSMHSDQRFRQKVKAVLIRHQQNLPKLVSLTTDRECYPGDQGLPSLRELQYGPGYSSYSDIVSNLRAIESAEQADGNHSPPSQSHSLGAQSESKNDLCKQPVYACPCHAWAPPGGNLACAIPDDDEARFGRLDDSDIQQMSGDATAAVAHLHLALRPRPPAKRHDRLPRPDGTVSDHGDCVCSSGS